MSAPESSTIAVLAEKPSVARDVARVLGATTKGDGYLHGGGYVVTWAVGHLVALARPHEIQPEWRQWRRDLLPIIPKDWPLVVYEKTKDQFEVMRTILNSQRVSQVVCATDAGREGELIFRYILRGSSVREAGQPTVDFLPHAGCHPEGFRYAAVRKRLRLAGGCSARTQSSRLAGRHEPLTCLVARVWRPAVGRASADAYTGYARRA
jgi:DNA topoisomerase-3